MSQRILNSIGLVLGIIGVTILFFFGPPQPILETGVSIELESASVIDSSGKTVAQHNAEVLVRRQLHTIMSNLGLFFIGFGFVFQLRATWARPPQPTADRGGEALCRLPSSTPSSAASPIHGQEQSRTAP